MNSGMYTPPLTSINKKILILLGSFFLVDSILKLSFQFSLATYLSLSAESFFSGHIYTLITYPLIQKSFLNALFNGLVFWFIGGDLELRWGKKIYSQFLLFSLIGPGLFYVLVSFLFFQNSIMYSFPLIGVSGLTYSLLMAYGLIFSERLLTFMFLFPMKAKYFCMLLGGIELYMAIFSPYSKSSWAHLAAMLCGFFYLKFLSYRSGLKDKPAQKRKKKQKFTLIKGDKASKDDPRYWQ